MAKMTLELDAIAYEFFREFARCEYCLKAVGLIEPKRPEPTPDWGRFARELQAIFDEPPSAEFSASVDYFLTQPPKKQVLREGVLAWDDVLPNHKNQAELVLRLLCRVRNNLFHGGKFNGHWFEPQRSEDLIRHGLTLMRVAVESHPAVNRAYLDKAV
jgi:hypothetical protein